MYSPSALVSRLITVDGYHAISSKIESVKSVEHVILFDVITAGRSSYCTKTSNSSMSVGA